MPSYLVERYAPEPDGGELGAAIAAIGIEACIRHVSATYLPEDQTSLHVIEAPSAEVIRDALNDAAITHERIAQALESPALTPTANAPSDG